MHQPERQPNESFADYKARRAASKAAVRAMTCSGMGDQRRAPSSREQLRDGQRKNGHGPKGTYGLGLLTPQRRRNAARMAALHPLRDEDGALTRAGNPKRTWLAGVSAQRGY